MPKPKTEKQKPLNIKPLEIRTMEVKRLKAAAYNPRDIKATAFNGLRASVEKFGLPEPIVWNRRSNRIVGGHQRLKVLIDGGVKRTEVSVVDLDANDEKALNLALNNPGIQGQFTAAVGEIVAGLKLALPNLHQALLLDSIPVGTGQLKQGATDPDAVPAIPAKPVTRKGDLWVMGDHRLLCGDSTKPEHMGKLLAGRRATLLFTDPPYGVAIGAKNRMLNSFQPSGRNLTDIVADSMGTADLRAMLLAAFKLAREHLANDAAVFVCSPQNGSLGLMMMMMMMEAGLPVRHVLNWVKNSPTFSVGRLDYDYQHEPILFTWKKTHKRVKGGPFQTSLWAVDKPRASKQHPTMKPVELPANAILNHTTPGDAVLDIFCGSGSTLIACEQSGRQGYAMEIEPRYCDVTVRRWEEFTGKKATRQKA